MKLEERSCSTGLSCPLPRVSVLPEQHWEVGTESTFSPRSAYSAIAHRLFVGALVGGILLANMERDALKREEIEMNKLRDVEVGSITVKLCFSQFSHCVFVLITE